MVRPRILAQFGERRGVQGPLLISDGALRLFSTEALGCSEYAQRELNVFCLVDGFFYNHETLCQRYGLRNGSSPAKLFVAAYLESGMSVLDRLDGPFSFCLYDQRDSTLYFGRDYLGQRPLFYSSGVRRLELGSSIAELARLRGSSLQINHGALAEYLLDVRSSGSRLETLLCDIFRLSPGHYARWNEGRLSIHRFWTPCATTAAGFDPQATATELRSALAQAVQAVPAPVAVSLSGGLDSSALAALSAANGETAAFSISFFDNSGDERHFLQIVREALRQHSFDVAYEAPSIDWLRAQSRSSLDVAVPPNSWLSHLIRRSAAERGYRSILTGWGGDELLTGFPPPMREKAPLLDERILRPALRLLKQLLPFARWYPEWCTQRFYSESGIEDRLRQQQATETFDGSQQAVAEMLWGAYTLQLRDAEERESAQDGLEVAHPFYTKRVFELLFPLSMAQLQFDGRPKALLRHALQERLPQDLLDRRDKAEFSFVWIDAVRQCSLDDFRLPRLRELGWVSIEKVAQEYTRLRSLRTAEANAQVQAMTRLWNLLAAEAFLVAVDEFNRSQAREP